MYELTLFKGDRLAVDWIGHRYATGDSFWKALHAEGVEQSGEWDAEGTVTYRVPEHVAWAIRDLFASEDWLFPCFDGDLSLRLQAFADEVV